MSVAIFIDAEYVIQGLRVLREKPSDFVVAIEDIYWERIVHFAARGREVGQVNYYTSELDKDENPDTFNHQQEYVKQIQRAIPGVTVRLGRMQKVYLKAEKTWNEQIQGRQPRVSTWVQKGIDIRIAIDMISKAYQNEYDTAILIAVDNDFTEVLEEVKKLHKRVEIISLDREGTPPNLPFFKIADVHTLVTRRMGLNRLWAETYRSRR